VYHLQDLKKKEVDCFFNCVGLILITFDNVYFQCEQLFLKRVISIRAKAVHFYYLITEKTLRTLDHSPHCYHFEVFFILSYGIVVSNILFGFLVYF